MDCWRKEGKRFCFAFNYLGLYIFANGDVYDGEWENGKMNGTGKLEDKEH